MRFLKIMDDTWGQLKRILVTPGAFKKNGTLRKVAAGMVLLLANPPGAAAFVTIKSASSPQDVHWNIGQTVTYRANTTNKSGLSADAIFNTLTTSLQRWKQAAFGNFSFLYYQGTDASRYPNQIGIGGDNSIFFTSAASGSQNKLACGTVGLTSLWMNAGSGIITKADVRINDECYQFTTNPSDTGRGNLVYLGDLVTHELGHTLGLDHSQNMQSTMVYTSAKQTFLPSCDDQAGIRALYAPNHGTGKLIGRLYSQSGAPVFGAHVTAISLNRGVAVTSNVTDRDGSFSLQELEPGSYAILAEPYYPGNSSLGGYYNGSSSSICGGALFERSFQEQGGSLLSFDLSGSQVIDVGNMTASCSKPQSQGGGQENSFSSAPTLALNENNLLSSQAILGVFSSTSTHYYKIPNALGTIKASVTAQSLYSIPDMNVRFLNALGQTLSQTNVQNLMATSASGYVNTDATAEVQVNEIQDIYVQVYTSRYNTSSAFPSLSVGVDGTPFYVLGLTHNNQTNSVYSPNARCEMSDQFSSYSSLGEAPAISNPSNSNSSGKSGGCGTLSSRDGSDDPDSNIRFINLTLMMGICMAAWVAARKSNKVRVL